MSSFLCYCGQEISFSLFDGMHNVICRCSREWAFIRGEFYSINRCLEPNSELIKATCICGKEIRIKGDDFVCECGAMIEVESKASLTYYDPLLINDFQLRRKNECEVGEDK